MEQRQVPTVPPDPSKLSALLADTDERSLDIMSGQFTGCRYQVTRSTASGTFRDLLSRADPAALGIVVVEDCFLAEVPIQPAEIAEQVPDAVIVVASSRPSFAGAVLAGRGGAHLYLPKPVWVPQVLASMCRGPQPPDGAPAPPPSLERMRWEYVQLTLRSCGSIRQTSQILNVPRRTLQRFLARNPPIR
jgi:ActR/RegA family two-component response regulator